MPAITPNSQPISLTPRLTLAPAPGWRGSVLVAAPGPLVLGEEHLPSAPTLPLRLFKPAEPAIELDLQHQPGPAVLGDEAAAGGTLEYQPGEPAVYVLLHEIHTPDGVIYDLTLPDRQQASGPLVLGEPAVPGALRFPINPLVGGLPPAQARPATLGLEDLVGDALADLVTKRVLQVLRSPIDRALIAAIRRFEPKPRMLALRDGGFAPLDGAEAWRALLPPGSPRRVLLYVHGFGSSTAASGGARFVPDLAAGYDAVLSYDHPTATRSPLENARDLLTRVPDDLQLSVDLVAHSRGGLVVRSLVELIDATPQFQPRRLITAGSPHAGTRLAEPARWDRLVSMGLTLGSWLATLGGGAFWAPKLLEFVLKAAAQSIFDLPGIAAMTPGSEFLATLNRADPPGLDERVGYAAVTSAFAISDVLQQGFQQAFTALAMQVFMGEPNDLVVHTASALEIDPGARMFSADQQYRATIDHSSYFQDAGVQEFIRRHFAG